MIKGGFQGLDISGVDLTAQSPTLPGAYATCAGADGKPIRVQTADGQVECSVKKVSTNYVLAGITGEGKILSITISSTDGISVSEVEIPSAEESNFITDWGNKVDLTTYVASNKYTTPSDGYIYCTVGATDNASGDKAECVILAKSGSSTTSYSVAAYYNEGEVVHDLFFVKKGFQLYGRTLGTGSGTKTVDFLPLVEV